VEVQMRKTEEKIEDRIEDTEERVSEERNDDLTPIFKDREDDKVVEEKITPKQRFFNAVDKLGNLVVLNLLFTLTCIPVVTIGASIVALLTMTNRLMNNSQTYIVREYFDVFKKNFKKATILWILQLVAAGLIYYQMYRYADPATSDTSPLKYIIPLECLIFTIGVPLQLPLVARYENTIINYIINSFVFALYNFFTLLSMVSPIFVVILLYIAFPNAYVYTWYLWFLILTSLLFYYYSYILKRMYAKIEAQMENADSEAEDDEVDAESDDKESADEEDDKTKDGKKDE
jgi:uncharacterized membrane protein YesL